MAPIMVIVSQKVLFEPAEEATFHLNGLDDYGHSQNEDFYKDPANFAAHMSQHYQNPAFYQAFMNTYHRKGFTAAHLHLNGQK